MCFGGVVVVVGSVLVCRREVCVDFGAVMCQNSSFGKLQFGTSLVDAVRAHEHCFDQ